MVVFTISLIVTLSYVADLAIIIFNMTVKLHPMVLHSILSVISLLKVLVQT